MLDATQHDVPYKRENYRSYDWQIVLYCVELFRYEKNGIIMYFKAQLVIIFYWMMTSAISQTNKLNMEY